MSSTVAEVAAEVQETKEAEPEVVEATAVEPYSSAVAEVVEQAMDEVSESKSSFKGSSVSSSASPPLARRTFEL